MDDNEYELKVCLFADKAVGKKTLKRRYLNSIFEKDLGSEIGVDFRSKNIEIHGMN